MEEKNGQELEKYKFENGKNLKEMLEEQVLNDELPTGWKGVLTGIVTEKLSTLTDKLGSQSVAMNKDAMKASEKVVEALDKRLNDKNNSNPEKTEENLLKAQENANAPVLEREKTIRRAVEGVAAIALIGAVGTFGVALLSNKQEN